MGSDGKKKQKKMKKNRKSGEAKAISDERFASAVSDPRFMEAPKRRSKVELDSRFSRVLTDARFAPSNAPVDKRGKRRKSKGEASLSHYYSLQPQEEDENQASPQKIDDEENEDSDKSQETENESEKSEDGESFNESSSASSTTDSDSDDLFMDEEEEEEDTFMPQEENVPEIDQETKRLAVVSMDWSQVRVKLSNGMIMIPRNGLKSRQRNCNGNCFTLKVANFYQSSAVQCWVICGILQAVDLYVLLSSFLPKGGQILSVAVYPSEFGIKRMEEEAVRGPIGLFEDDEEENDDIEDDKMNNKKLRAYELSRLRYYYAVVECDSSATADYLYKSCDGVEFERSANKLDLRFIPDSMEFKHQPRDVATEAPANYEGTNFQTSALQQSNISLTWDEDEPQRAQILKRKLSDKQLEELELKEFLASDESESEADDEDNDEGVEDESVKKSSKRDKYRALIQSGDDGSDVDREEDGDLDMEVTFNSGLEDLSKRILEKKDRKSETVWEAVLRKRKDKKKKSKKGSKYSSDDSDDESDDDRELSKQQDDFFVEEPSDARNENHSVGKTKKRKMNQENRLEAEASQAELELLAADDVGTETNLRGYNIKPKKIKGKKGKANLDEGKIPSADYDDPRFASFFTSPLFALDPTDPQFKRSAAYARQITEKQKKGEKDNVVEQTNISEIPGSVQRESGGLPQLKEKNELSSLVKSIKMKSNQVHPPHKVSKKYKSLTDKEIGVLNFHLRVRLEAA
ncbi:pre-rRNA-processing protein ESF1 [Striga asiatica]|uniref:Pre-rRNA-processing protein ESF1 n=1 Tax=Striga asiatica TaxID=4170 RepID=A0A5A7P283_STRAF|nr:pre-rRNA-processing protein ESF1 [Striga asiatica]